MAPLLHRQPWKGLFLLLWAIQLVFKIPFWAIKSLPRSRRPRPSWSISRCVRLYTLRSTMEFPVKLGLVLKRDLTVEVANSTLKNSKFVWIPGLREDFIQGELKEYADKAGVKPSRVPGYWQYKVGTLTESVEPPKDGEKVVYHAHGGALYLGSAHPKDATARIPRGILKHSKRVQRTFAVDYRLCASEPFVPEHPFPSAILDFIAGYRYLLDLGFTPENIIFAGDSAGGNLCLAAARYIIRTPQAGIPVPGGLLLFSPWGDLATTHTDEDSSVIKNMHSDMFIAKRPAGRKGFAGYAVRSYLGKAFEWKDAETNPYLSPSSKHVEGLEGMFKDFPKTYILAGEAERILDDSKILAERMSADNTEYEWIKLDIAEDEIHDFVAFPWCEPARTQALTRICAWIDVL
ncbi:hypothetical protein M422DRAFT_32962 [Sphaerobolus stellatus SS14]|uniref:Alpha/beta hydrolase fold-3 domain-containing protein n=1 Tax=Sphaerobolus stellatus (strain SS14) TaxID=990650 RepID=A0A0C9U7F6_SPHS4|nr:hypothetical protein M422DRAFT_32962 [Sphaerobolus stellatus SS14]